MTQKIKSPDSSSKTSGLVKSSANNLILPHDREAEQILLGDIIVESSLMEEVIQVLNPDDFYDTNNQRIFQTLKEMFDQGIPIDIRTLTDELKSRGLYEQIGGFEYLTYLDQLYVSAANWKYYADKIEKFSTKRSLQIFLAEIQNKIQKNKLPPDNVIQKIYQKLQQLDSFNVSPLKPISIKEIEESSPVETLWGDIFFPAGITQVNAEPGVGKTTFLYNLCLHGVIGREFLGVTFPKKIKVLYIDVETPAWKRGNKLKSITSEELPESFYFLDSLNLKNDFNHLLVLCKREKYDLIIFDTQSRILGMEEENDNAEANYYMGLLRTLAKETGVSIVLIHHTNKSERKGVYSGRGASAIAAAVDVVVNMELLDEEVIKIQVAKNRIVGDYPKLFIRKIGEDRFEPYSPPDEGHSGFEKFKAQDFILSLAHDRQWKTSDIKTHGGQKGFSESTIKRAISGLVQTGKLRKVGHGLYEISVKSSKVQKFTPIPQKAELLTQTNVSSQDQTEFPSYLE